MKRHEGRTRSAMGWTRPAIGAAVMIVLSYVAFVFVPNTLLGYLSTRVVPTWRDLIVVAWWAMAFVACCWVFVRLQRGRA
jgi:hypothetical protein